MELYNRVAYDTARHIALSYSTSFGISSRLFSKDIKPHIYAIYGIVRSADEIVDTYRGSGVSELIDELEHDVYRALELGYSSNLLVHAFAQTARKYDIGKSLIGPFFTSMRMDIRPDAYVPEKYNEYIHGSAEVVGLMCLKVFCDDDNERYTELSKGAAALGAAYQKVNFLRDMASDHRELGRVYFPGISFETFDDEAKRQIISDIRADFQTAHTSLYKLPLSSRKATRMSYVYYNELLKKLENTPASVIKKRRVRLPSQHKFALMVRTLIIQGRYA